MSEFRLEGESFQILLTKNQKLDQNTAHNYVVSEDCGAVVTFHGTTRNASKDGKECIQLDYSAYPEMALKQLSRIIEASREKYNLHKVAVFHHLGSVPPLESGVIGKCLLDGLRSDFNVKFINSVGLVKT